MFREATVVELIPDRGGVRVLFRDLVRSGFGASDFVRVLQPRMHDTGGACLWLPEVGEYGVVAPLGDGFVWVGSLAFQNANQVDPSPGIFYVRHQSGTVIQIRGNGDFEAAHPSGARITLSKAGGALPELKATSKPMVGGDPGDPVVEISHPSGAMVAISSGGDVSASTPANVNVEGSAVTIKGGTITLDGPVTMTQTAEIMMVAMVNGGLATGPSIPTGIIPGSFRCQGVITGEMDVVGNGKSLHDHVHREQGDGNPTSAPL
jgi:hypothetical protein